jgi:hypothetical protein
MAKNRTIRLKSAKTCLPLAGSLLPLCGTPLITFASAPSNSADFLTPHIPIFLTQFSRGGLIKNQDARFFIKIE